MLNQINYDGTYIAVPHDHLRDLITLELNLARYAYFINSADVDKVCPIERHRRLFKGNENRAMVRLEGPVKIVRVDIDENHYDILRAPAVNHDELSIIEKSSRRGGPTMTPFWKHSEVPPTNFPSDWTVFERSGRALNSNIMKRYETTPVVKDLIPAMVGQLNGVDNVSITINIDSVMTRENLFAGLRRTMGSGIVYYKDKLATNVKFSDINSFEEKYIGPKIVVAIEGETNEPKWNDNLEYYAYLRSGNLNVYLPLSSYPDKLEAIKTFTGIDDITHININSTELIDHIIKQLEDPAKFTIGSLDRKIAGVLEREYDITNSFDLGVVDKYVFVTLDGNSVEPGVFNLKHYGSSDLSSNVFDALTMVSTVGLTGDALKFKEMFDQMADESDW